jgi:BirA family biotin operon repressor/biotin-[acetyl-CoA-carboxylase] ligase
MAERRKCKYIHFEQLTSTNDYLKEYEDIEEGELVVVSADNQTAGRGQRGNSWESAEGQNLLFSILIRPYHVQADEQFILSEAIALSMQRTLDRYTSDIRIKWPNDIYWKDRKIAGTLIENRLCGTSIERSVLGTGLNVNQKTFVGNAPNPVSLLQITGMKMSTEKLLHEIMEQFANFCQAIENGERKYIYEQYFHVLYHNDGFYQYADANGVFEATITGIEPSGVIVLTDRSGRQRYYAFKEVKSIITTTPQP